MEIDLEVEVRRAQNGNKDAFIDLVKPLEVQMYNVAKSIVKNDEDCADAMQEAILKAYKSLSTLNTLSYFKTWLFRILINECNMIRRKRSHTITMAEPPNLQISSPEYDNIDVREAVYRLEEIPRTIIILHYFQDLPLQQIADILELSEGAVKTRLFRARQTLSQWLADSTERKVKA